MKDITCTKVALFALYMTSPNKMNEYIYHEWYNDHVETFPIIIDVMVRLALEDTIKEITNSFHMHYL